MFKKTLIAASVILASTSAMAGTASIASGKVDLYSLEFIANETTGIAFSDVAVDLDAQYSAGDVVTLTIAGAQFDTTNSVPAAAYTEDLTANPTMTLGLLSIEANKVTFRITAAAGNHGDAEAGKFSKITFSGLKLTTASAVAATSTISATYAAQTSTGIAIDASSKNTVNVMKGVTQYKAAVTTKLDAVISVASLRKNFGTGVYADAQQVTFSQYTPSATEATVAALWGAAPTATKVTLKGNFSFLDTNGDGKITAADKIPLATAFAANGTATAITPAANLQSVTFTGPTTFGTSGLTITAGNAAGDTTITNQSFSVDTEMTYAPKTGAAVKKTISIADSGKWSLDGASATISYVPYGDAVEQFLWVTNSGTVAGDISVTGFDQDGKSYGPYALGSSGKGLTSIGPDLATKLAADGVGSKRVSLTVTVNAPKDNVEFYAAYKVKADSDRLTLNVKKAN